MLANVSQRLSAALALLSFLATGCKDEPPPLAGQRRGSADPADLIASAFSAVEKRRVQARQRNPKASTCQLAADELFGDHREASVDARRAAYTADCEAILPKTLQLCAMPSHLRGREARARCRALLGAQTESTRAKFDRLSHHLVPRADSGDR